MSNSPTSDIISEISKYDLSTLSPSEREEISAILEKEAVKRAQKSFYSYVLLLGPTRIDGFQDGRHIEIICEELQELAEKMWGTTGLTQRKQISLPPGGMKSELCSRLFPSWVLGRWPHTRILVVGHSIDFAKDEFGAKVRDIIRMPEFQRIFPNTELREDKQTTGRFLTKAGGELFCTSLDAKNAGRRCHLCIVDDALVEEDAMSKPVRNSMTAKYKPNIRSRILTKPDGAELLSGTRWTVGDLFDYLENEDKKSGAPWKIIKIPALLTEESSQYLRREGDPDMGPDGYPYLMPGSSFWPEFQSTRKLEMLRGSYVNDMSRWNAVYMQALSTCTPIPTPTGWTTIGELKVGDYVFGADGSPIKVLNKTDVFKNREVFKLETNDGAFVLADKDHLWKVRERRSRFNLRNTQYLVDKYLGKRNKLRPAIPTSEPLSLPEADLPIDPYVFGLWLGDGNRAQAVINADEKDQPFYISEIEKAGFVCNKLANPQTFSITGGFQKKLRLMGALQTKKVPAEYLRASVPQRLSLLQGLMDTDGTCSKGQASFANTDPHLIEVVCELVLSLGRKPFVTKYTPKAKDTYKTIYRVNFYLEEAFRLPRKRRLSRNAKVKVDRFLDISRHGVADTQCITVDSPDGLFLAGKGFMVTHNCPIPDTGQLVNPEDFRKWEHDKPPECHTVVVTLDTAYTKGTQSDFSAYQVWGLFKNEHSEGKTCAILLDAKKGKWEFPELVNICLDLYHNKSYRVDYLLIEERSSGLALIPELRNRGLPVEAWKSEKDKMLRMQAAAPLVKSGKFWVPMPPSSPDVREKVMDFIKAIVMFPAGSHDDEADAFSQLVIHFRDSGMLSGEGYVNPSTHDIDDDDYDYSPTTYSSVLLRGR